MKWEFANFVPPAPEWLKAVQADAKSKGLNKLTLREIDRIIADTRADEREEQVGKPVRLPRR